MSVLYLLHTLVLDLAMVLIMVVFISYRFIVILYGDMVVMSHCRGDIIAHPTSLVPVNVFIVMCIAPWL